MKKQRDWGRGQPEGLSAVSFTPRRPSSLREGERIYFEKGLTIEVSYGKLAGEQKVSGV